MTAKCLAVVLSIDGGLPIEDVTKAIAIRDRQNRFQISSSIDGANLISFQALNHDARQILPICLT